MAGIELSYTYNDGRYISVGNTREIYGDQSVETLLNAGIDTIISTEGKIPDKDVIIKTKKNKSPKPSLINKKVVLLAEHVRGEWKSVKRK